MKTDYKPTLGLGSIFFMVKLTRWKEELAFSLEAYLLQSLKSLLHPPILINLSFSNIISHEAHYFIN